MKRRRLRKHARPTTNRHPREGQPVCAVLKDGRYFIGRIEGIENGELILSGIRGKGHWHPRSEQANRAQVSGFLDSLLGGGAGGFGGAGGAGNMDGTGEQSAGGSAGSSGLGGLGSMMSTIRIGMNMLQAIMPLLSLFKV